MAQLAFKDMTEDQLMELFIRGFGVIDAPLVDKEAARAASREQHRRFVEKCKANDPH